MSLLGQLARRTETHRVWFRWPFTVALAIILGHRENLRRDNLTDTETTPPSPPEPHGDFIGARTVTGAQNDLAQPWMGMAGARFARNVELKAAFGETGAELMDPSPRLVSNKLMARQAFKPVPHLNVLAAAWIQFMVHDWLSHGKNDKTVLHEIPLPDGDDWSHGPMTVPRTTPDEKTDADAGRPTSYANIETHWWDASQIYGSTADRMAKVRAGAGLPLNDDGTLPLQDNGLLPIDPEANVELQGVSDNWWIGLSLLHTLFVREHNAVVARLKLDHPDKDGAWLFDKARLVLAALLS